MKLFSNRSTGTMPLRPFNEHILWKGQIQQRQMQKSNIDSEFDISIYFDSSRHSTITHADVDQPRYTKDLNYRYSVYSQNYWTGVKERAAEYRRQNAVPLNIQEEVQEQEVLPEPVIKPKSKWPWFKYC